MAKTENWVVVPANPANGSNSVEENSWVPPQFVHADYAERQTTRLLHPKLLVRFGVAGLGCQRGTTPLFVVEIAERITWIATLQRLIWMSYREPIFRRMKTEQRMKRLRIATRYGRPS